MNTAHELRVDAAIIKGGIDGVTGKINRGALAERLERYAKEMEELNSKAELSASLLRKMADTSEGKLAMARVIQSELRDMSALINKAVEGMK